MNISDVLNVGYIHYSNSFPFLYEAQRNPVDNTEIKTHAPAELNQKLHKKELDISAISAFEYLVHSEQYLLLPELCINSTGYVKSVLLFSKVPIQDLNHSKILVSSESATSINLLRILLREKGVDHFEFEKITPQHHLEQAQSILLIGDAALQFKSQQHSYVYDLAQEWNLATGLPVVFALWAVQKDIDPKWHPTIVEVYQQHIRARDALTDNRQHIIEAAEQSFPNLQLDLEDYYKHLDYTLKPEGIESLKLYTHKLIELNQLQTIPNFSFYQL